MVTSHRKQVDGSIQVPKVERRLPYALADSAAVFLHPVLLKGESENKGPNLLRVSISTAGDSALTILYPASWLSHSSG